tara:strand:- start:246 stop:1205 length:960 start_codon:yes stop_codon:yes gene_type:complete
MNDFKNIFGQDLAIQILKSAISKEHFAPAYLFSGPEGVGRKKTAKLFIQAMLDTGLDKEKTKRIISSNNHPDLLWIEPSYTFQGKSISKSQAKLENIHMKAPPKIRLNAIKGIIEFLGKKPMQSKKSIVIIEDIESMNESASNALLKTLEEPNEGIFILITQRAEKLLTTIRSRCQIIPFQRLNDNQLKIVIKKINNIEGINDIPNETIRELIAFSNGSPGQYLANIKFWLDIPSSFRHTLITKLSDQIEALKLAKAITDELNIEQQLWIIDFQQNIHWNKESNSKIIKRLEKLRQQILSYVQPRLAWELTLLEINFIN